VTLRVVGCDKKGTLESETVKYGREVPKDFDPRKISLARASSIFSRPVLSSERTPHKHKTVTVKE
jgi:hypothetical protein